MTVDFKLDGLNELITALKHLPEELVQDAEQIVSDATYAAGDEVKTIYQRFADETGGSMHDLISGVVVTVDRQPRRVVGHVKSTSGFAWMFEHGTKIRKTRKGWNRGQIKPLHAVIPTCMRHRRVMYARLADMLRRAGLLVSEAA